MHFGARKVGRIAEFGIYNLKIFLRVISRIPVAHSVLPPRHQYSLGSPAFPLFLFYERTTAILANLVTARMKENTLNPDDMNSYRPISNMSFTFKLVERAVASRFVGHCESNILFPVGQSAYRKCHSTETAVTIVSNDIVRAVD